MVQGIHHTAISTPNLERVLGFHRDLLGFEGSFELESPPPTAGDPESPVCDHGITQVALDVRDPEGNVVEEDRSHERPP